MTSLRKDWERISSCSYSALEQEMSKRAKKTNRTAEKTHIGLGLQNGESKINDYSQPC